MCRDLEATFLLSTIEGFFLVGKDESFPFFVEDLDADNSVEVDAAFDTLGVLICDALVTGDAALVTGDDGFLFSLATFLSLFNGVTCTSEIKKTMSHQMQNKNQSL